MTSNGIITQTGRSESEVVGPATFNGQTAIEVRARVHALSGSGVGPITDSRSYVRLEGHDLLTLGNSSAVVIAGVVSTTTSTISPPSIWRYSLGTGQSVTTNSSVTTTTMGLPFAQPPTTVDQVYTVTFRGFEDVTVPAGTFSGACKWDVTTSSSSGTTTSTQWLTRKGAALKSVSGAEVTELVSGSINGGPVGP